MKIICLFYVGIRSFQKQHCLFMRSFLPTPAVLFEQKIVLLKYIILVLID